MARFVASATRTAYRQHPQPLVRVTDDATTQPDGAFIGTVEIEIRPGADHQEERVRTWQDECDRLRDGVAELERLLARSMLDNDRGERSTKRPRRREEGFPAYASALSGRFGAASTQDLVH